MAATTKTKRAALRSELAALRADFAGTEADLTVANRRVQELLSALCWYAYPANYQGTEITMDEGERARRALASPT